MPCYMAVSIFQGAKESSVISENISWVSGMLRVNGSMLAEHTENPDAQGSFPDMNSLNRRGQDIGI